MAYSSEQWERAKAYFEAGTHTLQKIEDEVGINKGHLSRTAKKQQWKQGSKSDYIEARIVIAEKKATEKATTIQVLDNIADEAIRHKNLINSNAELLASHIPKVVNSFITKQINQETGEEEEIYALEAKTIKELAEANDKLAITLKVAERHANIKIDNTNAQQTNQPTQIIIKRDE